MQMSKIEGELGDPTANPVEVRDQNRAAGEQHSSNSVTGLDHSTELTSYVFVW